MNKILFAITTTLIIFTTGCTSIPTVEKGSDEYNKLLQFQPVDDKAVMYIYRRADSDLKGHITTIDIGKTELATVGDCVVRHIVEGGDFNIEPNGNGAFAIEKELDASFPAGSVSAVELKHTTRLVLPNISELFLRDIDDLKSAIEQDSLCIIDGSSIP